LLDQKDQELWERSKENVKNKSFFSKIKKMMFNSKLAN
jgi:hypothetical protein